MKVVVATACQPASVSREPPQVPSSPSTPLPSRHTPRTPSPTCPDFPFTLEVLTKATFGGKKDYPCLQMWVEETNQPREKENHGESSKEKHPIYYPQPPGKITLKTRSVNSQSVNSHRVPRDARLRPP